MIRARSYGLTLLVTMFVTPSAQAFNFGGHMFTGAVAYDTLKKENPQALAAAVALLKQVPQYEKLWAKKLEKVDPDDRDQALFMFACRWADDIRSDPDYNRPEWHYIDYPFKPADQPDSVLTAEPPNPNIETAFRTNVEILKGNGPDAEKAVALCWIMHLVGDCHQPLHSVALFTTDHPAPKGDEGGNKEFVRAKPDGEPLKLHSFWDGLVTGTDDTREIRKLAIELSDKYPQAKFDPQPRNVTPADFANWVQESFAAAKANVYLEGKLAASTVRESAPVMPADYIQQAKSVGQQRATLAGYRLADILASILP